MLNPTIPIEYTQNVSCVMYAKLIKSDGTTYMMPMKRFVSIYDVNYQSRAKEIDASAREIIQDKSK